LNRLRTPEDDQREGNSGDNSLRHAASL
jgi:hypothetical protein